MARMNPDHPDDLRRTLREWRDVPAPDAGLAARVQRDVGAGRQRTGRVVPLRFALAGMAVGMLLGVASVEWYQSRAEAAGTPDMQQRYLAWIDPLVGTRK